MKGFAIAAEDRQGLVLGCRGEGKETHVRLPTAFGHGAEQALQFHFAFFLSHLLRLSAQRLATQHTLELGCGLTGLGAVRLIDDHGIASGRKVAVAPFAALLVEFCQLTRHERKFLQRGDDDRDAGFQRLGELTRILVDLLNHALAVIELVDGVLQLAIQHHAIGDHDHAVEQPLVAFVMQAG